MTLSLIIETELATMTGHIEKLEQAEAFLNTVNMAMDDDSTLAELTVYKFMVMVAFGLANDVDVNEFEEIDTTDLEIEVDSLKAELTYAFKDIQVAIDARRA